MYKTLLHMFLALALTGISTAPVNAQEMEDQTLQDEIRVAKNVCDTIYKLLDEGVEAKKIVKTGIEIGHNSCLIIKCAISAGGDLEEIIFGAVQAGASADVIVRCSIDAGADRGRIAQTIQEADLSLCYLAPGTEYIAPDEGLPASPYNF